MAVELESTDRGGDDDSDGDVRGVDRGSAGYEEDGGDVDADNVLRREGASGLAGALPRRQVGDGGEALHRVGRHGCCCC
jgi:hypothetical protein